MEEKQIANRETIGIGCAVSVGTSIIVILLAGSFYALPFIFVYILLALPFGFAGAFIGKKLTKTRIGIWIGALVATILEYWWLYSHITSLVLSD